MFLTLSTVAKKVHAKICCRLQNGSLTSLSKVSTSLDDLKKRAA